MRVAAVGDISIAASQPLNLGLPGDDRWLGLRTVRVKISAHGVHFCCLA